MAKSSKNGNNEGSIRERKKGQWEARITIGIDSEENLSANHTTGKVGRKHLIK